MNSNFGNPLKSTDPKQDEYEKINSKDQSQIIDKFPFVLKIPDNKNLPTDLRTAIFALKPRSRLNLCLQNNKSIEEMNLPDTPICTRGTLLNRISPEEDLIDDFSIPYLPNLNRRSEDELQSSNPNCTIPACEEPFCTPSSLQVKTLKIPVKIKRKNRRILSGDFIGVALRRKRISSPKRKRSVFCDVIDDAKSEILAGSQFQKHSPNQEMLQAHVDCRNMDIPDDLFMPIL